MQTNYYYKVKISFQRPIPRNVYVYSLYHVSYIIIQLMIKNVMDNIIALTERSG